MEGFDSFLVFQTCSYCASSLSQRSQTANPHLSLIPRLPQAQIAGSFSRRLCPLRAVVFMFVKRVEVFIRVFSVNEFAETKVSYVNQVLQIAGGLVKLKTMYHRSDTIIVLV